MVSEVLPKGVAGCVDAVAPETRAVNAFSSLVNQLSVDVLAPIAASEEPVAEVSSSVVEGSEGFACEDDCFCAPDASAACTPTPTPFIRMSRNDTGPLFELATGFAVVSVLLAAALGVMRTPF